MTPISVRLFWNGSRKEVREALHVVDGVISNDLGIKEDSDL